MRDNSENHSLRNVLCMTLFVGLVLFTGLSASADSELERIVISEDQTHFVSAASNTRFTPWGVNYDHNTEGQLLEEYWLDEWDATVEDFKEIKSLGGNVARVHLQVSAFMNSATETSQTSINQLKKLLILAEDTGLYLNITGLGCYHKDDVPAWYDAMSESARWEVQSRFWQAIASACKDSPAVFCYDLMNEPILPGANKPATDWLGGEFGGKYFVQRITLDLKERTRIDVAAQWVKTLTDVIRAEDPERLITVGVIPWAHVFPNANPLFYDERVYEFLDFASVHFYPQSGGIDKAIEALAVYDRGKPLVIEEMFPLRCSIDELDQFIERSNTYAEGWFGFYWGKMPGEYESDSASFADAITRKWLEYFQRKAPEMKAFSEQ